MTGAYRAVEFIKANIRLDSGQKSASRGQHAGRGNLHAVRPERHDQYLPGRVPADAGLRVSRLYFFIGYLISIAITGLYQAIFMANAGGAGTTPRRSSR